VFHIILVKMQNSFCIIVFCNNDFSQRLHPIAPRVLPSPTLVDKELRLAIINGYVRRVNNKVELEAYPRLSG